MKLTKSSTFAWKILRKLSCVYLVLFFLLHHLLKLFNFILLNMCHFLLLRLFKLVHFLIIGRNKYVFTIHIFAEKFLLCFYFVIWLNNKFHSVLSFLCFNFLVFVNDFLFFLFFIELQLLLVLNHLDPLFRLLIVFFFKSLFGGGIYSAVVAVCLINLFWKGTVRIVIIWSHHIKSWSVWWLPICDVER